MNGRQAKKLRRAALFQYQGDKVVTYNQTVAKTIKVPKRDEKGFIAINEETGEHEYDIHHRTTLVLGDCERGLYKALKDTFKHGERV